MEQAPCGPLSRLHDHTRTHHTRLDFSGRVINPMQRPLPDNTQHSQQTSVPPAGFEPAIVARERPQTHALDGAATGIDIIKFLYMIV